MDTRHQANQPMTTYKKGDMAKTRWKLAVRRWIANQEKKQSLGFVLPMTATTKSRLAISSDGKQNSGKNTAPKHAAIGSDNATGANNNVTGCHASHTTHDNVRLCEFCFKPFTFKRDHAKYCGRSCQADAYHVRKAFADGRAAAYLETLEETP